MIEESPVNRMIGRSPSVRSSHIKEIGPHTHRWLPVGRDGTGETYRACRDCGTRSVLSGNFAGAERQDWLHGADWEPPVKEAEDPHEDFSFSRRRGRPPKNGGNDGHLTDQPDAE